MPYHSLHLLVLQLLLLLSLLLVLPQCCSAALPKLAAISSRHKDGACVLHILHMGADQRSRAAIAHTHIP